MGVSMTPDVWSQRQMDEEIDKAGEDRRLLWRSRNNSTRGLWSADGALQATRKSPVLGGLKLRWHTCFKVWIGRYPPAQAACGSTRGMGRAGIGVFSEVTGACLGLQNIISCPLFVACSVSAMRGDSTAFIMLKLTSTRLRRRFASLEIS